MRANNTHNTHTHTHAHVFTLGAHYSGETATRSAAKCGVILLSLPLGLLARGTAVVVLSDPATAAAVVVVKNHVWTSKPHGRMQRSLAR